MKPGWVYCELESKELLSICLKRVKGLGKVKLLDAKFKYTEEHSKRLIVELTIQKEVGNGIALKQSFEVLYVVHWMQCEDCQKEFTPHTWKACVQVRQKAPHKKTFLYLEQLMIKQRIQEKCISIMQEPFGLNFYFSKKNQAEGLMNFLGSHVPFRKKESKDLISHDEHERTYNYKFTFFLIMPKICKDDLIVMPVSLCRELGGVNALAVCYKVSNNSTSINCLTVNRLTTESAVTIQKL